MASDIPPSLKAVAPFIVKAHQMEKADPVISYFCYVYTVQQALAKGLTKSPEGMTYTGQVMDTLEQRRAELSDHEAVADDVVGKVYVEQFANKIFNNAENAQNARKCTKQTAETFMAASVFLELLRVFGELEPEIAQKITFAKYSAARILKALKAGEDPNPPIEEVPDDEVPPVFTDTEAPRPHHEVSPVSPVSPHPPAPTVEDAVDEAEGLERSMARISAADESLHPSRIMTPSNVPPPPLIPPSFPSPPETEAPLRPVAHLPSRTETMSTAETFPTQPPSAGYFPPAPYAHETSVAPSLLDLPSAPPSLPSAPSSLPFAPAAFPPGPTSPPAAPSAPPSAPFLPPKFSPTVTPQPSAGLDGFYSGAAALAGAGVGVGAASGSDPVFGGPSPHWLGHSAQPPAPSPMNPQAGPGAGYYYPPPSMASPPPPQRQSYTQPPAPSPFGRAPPVAVPPTRRLIDPENDLVAMKEAHKCIRWAESALNFDDVPTAVKNLRLALHTLGAE
ncbi:hypothetical protein ABW21_db0202638 [Orbilia brochopaga]|nr:hypothetical protein ABW21_db0202638 [Drechslerella brochopaga]